jgi:hypothetical protein
MELALDFKRAELKALIKEAVREVIAESGWEYFLKNSPYVSDKEMADIEAHHGKPEKEVFYSEDLVI